VTTYPGIDTSDVTDETPPGWVQVLAWNDLSVEAAVEKDTFETEVVLLDEDRWPRTFESLAQLFADEELVLAAGDDIRLAGSLEELAVGDWPFPNELVSIDAESWAYSFQGTEGAGGDWSVVVNGQSVLVDLGSFGVAGVVADMSKAGVVLELTSLDSPDIGCTLSADQFGCGWVSVWGRHDCYLGPDSFNDPVALLALGVGDFEIREIGEISSNFLDEGRLRSVIRRLDEVDWADLRGAEVSFDGKATAVSDWLGETV